MLGRRKIVGIGASAAAVLGAACGRVGFDPADRPGVDADPGASDAFHGPDATLVQPIHQYSLNFDLTDDYGGPDAQSLGGDLDAEGYRFTANLGLKLSGVMPVDVYSIDLVFSFSQLGGWRKIIDYKTLVTDEGLYTYDDLLQYVVVAGSQFQMSPPVWIADEPHQVTLTRDASGHVVGYVDRVFAFQFDDDARVAAIEGEAGPWVYLFVDDNATSQTEASAGVVRRIRIWDVALAADQIPL